MNLNILFWNINKKISPSADMLLLVDDVLLNKPDVFCVAEGPISIVNNVSFSAHLLSKGYNCYYSPSIHKSEFPKIDFVTLSYGLKIFIKDDFSGAEPFVFENQVMNGRIVYTRIITKINCYSLYFIHSFSKDEQSLKHFTTINELSNLIKAKSRLNTKDKTIIIGDFNMQPWEKYLCDPNYLESYFSIKKFKYFYEIDNVENKFFNKKIYYNPILECIEKSNEKYLISTFYKNKYYSIIDYPLITKDVIDNYELVIITELNGETLFKIAPRSKKVTLDREIDHLPILLKLK